MQIMAEIKIRTEEILLQCRYAGVISLSGPRPSSEDRGGGQGGCRVPQKLPVWVEWVVLLNASSWHLFWETCNCMTTSSTTCPRCPISHCMPVQILKLLTCVNCPCLTVWADGSISYFYDFCTGPNQEKTAWEWCSANGSLIGGEESRSRQCINR